ncbi:MAG: hypothetical protein D4R65_10465 [Verrucomicrobiaceae bacterium]|nr:MAG: hypothetical protein D4R65_10465 [Verrucomicrobiaceae bacterium]
MRAETDKGKLEAFFEAFGNRVTGEGRIYLTGGATAVLYGWRTMTIDVDIKGDPEPTGFFEAIAVLKDELDINIELASPDLFIPALPGWQERSLFIGRRGHIEFFHYDPYSQALAKIERGHDRDAGDVRALLDIGLIDKSRLLEYFLAVEKDLIRYPSIDSGTFRQAVAAFCAS